MPIVLEIDAAQGAAVLHAEWTTFEGVDEPGVVARHVERQCRVVTASGVRLEANEARPQARSRSSRLTSGAIRVRAKATQGTLRASRGKVVQRR